MNTLVELRDAPDSLQSVQHWMQSVIMRTGAANDSTPLLNDSPRLSATRRLGIYRFAYQARLCECLENEFPVLRRTVGEDAFRQLSVGYVRQFPSASYTLGRLSEHFVGYLRDTRPPRSTAEAEAPDWADYVIDLATLEHTVNQVFDGPGAETQRHIRAEDLARIAPDASLNVRFDCDPSLRLLVLRFPVHRQLRADRREAVSHHAQPQQTRLAVFRREYAVRWVPLSLVEFELLRRLAAGETLGNAVAAAASLNQIDARMILNSMRWIGSSGFLLG